MVQNIFENTKEEHGKKTQLLISFGFLLLNIIFFLLIIAACYWFPFFMLVSKLWISWIVLAVIYIDSYIIFFRKRDMNIFRIVETRLGGWIHILYLPIILSTIVVAVIGKIILKTKTCTKPIDNPAI